jgi:hypothetical protein
MADVPGCLACEATFPYPVLRRVVAGSRPPASPADVEAMLPLYVAAARELEREGAGVLTDNCNGLMVLMQQRLAAAVRVPVVTSGLLLVPLVHAMMPGRRIGILAFHPESVGEEVYAACGWSSREVPVAVAGVAGSAAWQEFLRTKEAPAPLLRQMQEDLIASARRLLAGHPDVGAFVSECTLLPPALQALRHELGLPVYDILTLLDLAISGRWRPAGARNGVNC